MRAAMFAVFSVLAFSGLARSSDDATPAGPVVVELFTSEGCSSCPPADRLLSRLRSEAREGGRPVVLLGFHVDYWDRLGWRDDLGSRAASARQQRYARALGRDGVYTPQIVVGGRAECVGSDEACVRARVARAGAATVALEAAAAWRGEALLVRARAPGAPAGALLTVAVVEDGIVRRIGRGENRGRTLTHDRAVRAFVESTLDDGDAAATLRLPDDVARARASLVVLVQDAASGEVLGATEQALPAR